MESCHLTETESGTWSRGLSPPRRSAEGLSVMGPVLCHGHKRPPMIGAKSALGDLLLIWHEGQLQSNRMDNILITTSGSVIEVFADIWCPFAHVGLRTIQEERARAGREDVAIWVRAWPLELVNGAPLDAPTTAEHVDELRGQVAPDLFRHFDTATFPTSTLDALALANRAYRAEPQVGELVSFALRQALFEEGRDVSDSATLQQIAHTLGVAMPDDSDSARVVADWHEGERRGVLGSPHFFCGDVDVFCPSLTIMKDPGKGISIHKDTSKLTDFLAGCLAPTAATSADSWR